MSAEPLTSDNHYLSRVKINAAEAASATIRADNFISEAVAFYTAAAVSENTRRTYRSDLAHFQAWGGRIPSEPTVVASYLADNAGILSPATLARRVATLAKAHTVAGFPNPCLPEIVLATLRGIKRVHGTAQRRARPLLREDLFRVLDTMGERTKDVRDRALLLVGFAGGFRRSELVGLDFADIAKVSQGLIITLRRSKTDQVGAGREIGVPFGRTFYCPVAALLMWLATSGIVNGPIFRPVNRHGHVHPKRLTGGAVSLVIRERVAIAGINPNGFSGHSLRAGFVTSAAEAGVSSSKIRQQTGHASESVLARYIRSGETFTGNAIDTLL
jgi:integrase